MIRGRAPPFDPSSVVDEFAKLLKDCGIDRITGNNYSAAWVETAWRDAGITYERSELVKSALYLESLPLFMRAAVSIPDHPRLMAKRPIRIEGDIAYGPLTRGYGGH